jgi:hypothetical protein
MLSSYYNNDGVLDLERPNEQGIHKRVGYPHVDGERLPTEYPSDLEKTPSREAATVEAARCCDESFLPTKTTLPPPTTMAVDAAVDSSTDK